MGCSNSSIKNNVTPTQPPGNGEGYSKVDDLPASSMRGSDEMRQGSGKNLKHKSTPPTLKQEEISEDLVAKKDPQMPEVSTRNVGKIGPQMGSSTVVAPINWKTQSYVQTDRTFNLMQSIYSGK